MLATHPPIAQLFNVTLASSLETGPLSWVVSHPIGAAVAGVVLTLIVVFALIKAQQKMKVVGIVGAVGLAISGGAFALGTFVTSDTEVITLRMHTMLQAAVDGDRDTVAEIIREDATIEATDLGRGVSRRLALSEIETNRITKADMSNASFERLGDDIIMMRATIQGGHAMAPYAPSTKWEFTWTRDAEGQWSIVNMTLIQ